MKQQRFDETFLADYGRRGGPLVTILPGSRTQEVASNLRWFLKAAAIVRERVPEARFAIAAFRDDHARTAEKLAQEANLPVDVFHGRTPELIHLSHCTMACSGSVSLELLYHAKPTVVLYWVPRLLYTIVRRFLIQVKYITLVNLLADPEPFASPPTPYDPHAPGARRVPFPEYATYEDRSEQIAEHVSEWLTDKLEYERRVRQLESLKQRFAQSGASERAAEFILQRLTEPNALRSAA
jgi:lipid-A-disaccharide synthase